MPRLLRLGGFVGAHFAAPGVGADRGNLFLVDPVCGFERHPRRIATGVTAPVARALPLAHHARTHDDEVAAPYVHALGLRGFVQIGVGDGDALIQGFHPRVPRYVQQHAAANRTVLDLVDGVLPGAIAVHKTGIVAVPHPVAVEDMPEGIPLGPALQRQRDHVVGIAKLSLVLVARHSVCPSGGHGVDRVEAVAPKAALRTLVIEIERQREDLALSDQPGGGDDVLGGDEIQRTDLIVRTPTPPVLAPLGGIANDLHVERAFVVASGHGRSPDWKVEAAISVDLGRGCQPSLEGEARQSRQILTIDGRGRSV